jgi:hypothetical protein
MKPNDNSHISVATVLLTCAGLVSLVVVVVVVVSKGEIHE